MALSLDWAFGFNKDIVGGVHNLSDESRSAIFYVAAHTGVIYDYAAREQKLLQGHCNPITCCCVSEDKRWIATADSGPDSVIVIWDSLSATPVKTIFSPHAHGVVAMDLSPDAMFLVTLSAKAPAAAPEGGADEKEADEQAENGAPQQIALWEWTNEREGSLYAADVACEDVQHSVAFNTGDIREIVTNGAERVIFWSWEARRFDYYSPPLSQRDFKQVVGAFTKSAFIPDSSQAITATVDGDLILWGRSLGGAVGAGGGGGGGPAEKSAIKIIRVSGSDTEGSAIWFLTPAEGYLVLGSDDGAVRFFDYQFRLVAWFEDLEAGAVTSVSFANTRPPPVADGLSETPFTVPDFVVGTKRAFVVGAEAAMFEEARPEERRGTLLVQGLDDEVHGLDAHPFLPQLAVSCYSGSVQLWDYAEKRLLMVRPFDARKLRPQTLGFDANGRFLAVGYTCGVLKVLDAASLDDVATFRCHLSHGAPRPAAVVAVAFSPDAQYLACATSDHHVAIWQFGVDGDKVLPEDEEPIEEWVYLGRSCAHSAPITGLSFALSPDQLPLLVSVGEDCRLVEYHLQKSTVAAGVVLRAPPTIIDAGAEAGVPTACMWHPAAAAASDGGGGGPAEGEQVLVANSAYKLKVWDRGNGVGDKVCARTVLGQTFGGPLNRLAPLPGVGGSETGAAGGGAEYVAYAAAHKVIGVMQLPLDGNPNKMMGLVAHPGEVSGLAVSFDGRYVLSAGGADVTVNLWATDVSVVGAEVEAGGGGASPFLRLLDGGEGGEAHNELVDYFYYAQIMSQGENSTEPRKADGLVPIARVPDLMRALGFYPTEAEVANMLGEATADAERAAAAAGGDAGPLRGSISLEGFIKLYLNHRPVFGVGKEQIQAAFDTLSAGAGAGVPWDELTRMLQNEGEKMSTEELQRCLGALVGDEDLPSVMTAGAFADNVLGFEDYAAGEVGEDELEAGEE